MQQFVCHFHYYWSTLASSLYFFWTVACVTLCTVIKVMLRTHHCWKGYNCMHWVVQFCKASRNKLCSFSWLFVHWMKKVICNTLLLFFLCKNVGALAWERGLHVTWKIKLLLFMNVILLNQGGCFFSLTLITCLSVSLKLLVIFSHRDLLSKFFIGHQKIKVSPVEI